MKNARHLDAANTLVIRVRVPVELVGEQVDDRVAVETRRRQRDIVNDDELDRRAVRASVAVGRWQLACIR